jgi:hypothetical protein
MIDQQIRPTWRPSEPIVIAPREQRRRRGTGLLAMVVTTTFCAVQLWAIMVVLVMLNTDGVARVALFALLIGSATAICLGFRELRAISIRQRQAAARQSNRPEFEEYVVR